MPENKSQNQTTADEFAMTAAELAEDLGISEEEVRRLAKLEGMESFLDVPK